MTAQPLALTHAQLDALMRTAKLLAAGDREPFLLAVADLLRDQVIGDGAVFRPIALAQRKFLHPPDFDHQPHHRGTRQMAGG
jgi:hypothetical protein